MNRVISLLALSILLCATNQLVSAQGVTSKQKRQVKTIAGMIDKAGRLYKSKKFDSAGGKINDANQAIQEMASVANSEAMKLLAKEYKRLEKAHELLTEKKIELAPLQPLPDPIQNNGQEVRFSNAVAPILIENCGRCHVNQSRGSFSMKDFQTLMDSTHVSPGRPDTSRLIEIIADGTMPPNGKVNKDDLDVLKSWIRAGAKYDGQNPNLNLNQLTGRPANGNAANNRVRLTPTPSDGTETISFGRDIAPILIESCSGCHINTRRIRGNFNMNNFARMLRGGDSGNPLVPGKPEESVLLNRLKGINSEVMPPNKKLSDKKIAVIEKWISEGATFDGFEPTMEIRNMAAVAKADAQSHEELNESRQKLGIKNWQLIMSDDQAPDSILVDGFRIYGSNRSGRLENIADSAAQIRANVISELNSAPEQPFVKGNATIFVFERRYDLNELGMMLAGGELPKEQTSYWDFTTIDAYSSVVLNRGKSAEIIAAELAQQLTALHIASKSPDVPSWFADGVGYVTASRLYKKDDIIKSWSNRAVDVANSMKEPFGFTSGQLNRLDSGLAGFVFVKKIKQSGDLNPLIRNLNQGLSFTDSFASVFGQSPNDFFSTDKKRRRR